MPAYVRPSHVPRRRHAARTVTFDAGIDDAARFVALLAPVAFGLSAALVATVELWGTTW